MSKQALRTASLAAACAAVLLAVPFVVAQTTGAPPAPATIRDLNARRVRVHKDTKADQANASRAMDNYRQFLDLQKTDPKLRAEALRRLGDLNLDNQEVDRLTSQLTASGDLQGTEAVKIYTTLLKVYPDYTHNDQVLYQLARAYDTAGQPEEALATLDEIVRRYPRTAQLDEVQFRRGELLFSAKRYHDAEGAYAAVITMGKASSFYEQSLYKHGWSLFKQSMTDESLPSFEKVLDRKLIGPGGRSYALEDLKRADRELVEDTLRVMSIAFSYAEGAASLEGLLKKEGDRPYAYLLYSHLGNLYVDKQRYQDAAAAYRAYVAHDPLTDEAPNLSMQAIEAYTKGGFTQLLLDGKHEFVQRYNFGSPFWRNRDRARYPKVVAELKVNLKDVATYFHSEAQKTKRLADYQEAATWYRQFLKSFPNEADSAATNYLLAQALFEGQQYSEAAKEYETTAYGYPGNEKSASAAYASLTAYQKAEEQVTGPEKAEMHSMGTEAGIRFAQSFPSHPDSTGVLTRISEEMFKAKDPRAVSLAQLVLDHRPPADAPKQRIAWTIIGQSHFDQGELAQAEPAFVRARDLAVTDPGARADLTERLATTVYKEAEQRRDAGDFDGAVDEFMRVGRVAPDSKVRPTAEYDAAAQLISYGNWERAIKVLEDFRRQFPGNSLQGEVSRKLAVAYSAAQHPGQAAVEFERLAGNQQDKTTQREALLQSADLYARASNYTKASAMLEKYISTNPSPLEPAEEARAKLADYALRSGSTSQRDRWYRELVLADEKAGAQRTQRTHYLAAKAALALAAPARDAFKDVRLTTPLKASLAGKRRALENALDAYKTAAAYNVAEVTTAATYEIAELYRQLAKDVMASERPAALRGNELEEYNSLLEEQVFPFEEQAIKAHEINAVRTRDGVYDDWVRKSFAALAELKPARYGKTEATPDVVTRLN